MVTAWDKIKRREIIHNGLIRIRNQQETAFFMDKKKWVSSKNKNPKSESDSETKSTTITTRNIFQD